MKSLAQAPVRADLGARLATVTPASVARWGHMSAHQMICHLADAFLMATGEKRVTLDTSLFKRTILKSIVLYAPVRWPSGILTSPELDQQRGGGTPPAEFAADVARVAGLLERVADPSCPLDRQLHPYFGRMSNSDWLRWGWLHVDHHLRQFGA